VTEAPRESRLAGEGVSLRALEWEGAPPTALLVHATSFCAEAWIPAWEAARAAGAGPRRAVAVDQRGHGRSEAPADPGAYAWTQLAADVAALAERLGADGDGGVIGIGHSSGATAVLAAAGAQPDRFAALVAVEPVLFDASPAARAGAADSFLASRTLADGARRRRSVFASEEEARARLRARFPFAAFDEAAFEAVLAGGLERRDDGTAALRCPGEREAWCYEGAAALDVWPRVASIRAPLLLVLAEHSAVPPPLRERLLAGRAGARVETVAGATHFAALERPAEVGAAIGRFLAEVAR
jgi:pimeloyl-ACP methyl ester carboxylesterase